MFPNLFFRLSEHTHGFFARLQDVNRARIGNRCNSIADET